MLLGCAHGRADKGLQGDGPGRGAGYLSSQASDGDQGPGANVSEGGLRGRGSGTAPGTGPAEASNQGWKK